jgi:hypothetical protein
MSTLKEKIKDVITKTLPAGPVMLVTLAVCFTGKATTTKDGYAYLLRPFLKWIRTQGCDPFLWKGEYNIHAHLFYHVLISGRLEIKEIRDNWNELQRKNGLLDEFKKMSGHYDPASIDVKVFKEPTPGDLQKYFPDLENNKLK